ncbi:MAG: hypothetical protein AAGB06_01740 [Verrucomicrobiota bacterium]
MFSKQFTLFVVLVFAGTWPVSMPGVIRTFTSSDGVTIEAELIAVDSLDRTTIRRVDGHLFREVPIEFFSDQDRKFIRNWKAEQQKALDNANITADSRVRINVGTNRDSDFNDYGDIDDQVVKYKPKISFYNEELEETFTGVNGTLVFIGEHVLDSSVMGVIYSQEFKIDVPPKEKTEWIGKPFMSRYDPDYGGFKYEGYLLVVRDQAGKLVQIKASRANWKNNFQRILKAKLKTAYDRKFESQQLGYKSY